MNDHPRHDISDRVWKQLELHLPGRKGNWGGQAKDNRLLSALLNWMRRNKELDTPRLKASKETKKINPVLTPGELQQIKDG